MNSFKFKGAVAPISTYRRLGNFDVEKFCEVDTSTKLKVKNLKCTNINMNVCLNTCLNVTKFEILFYRLFNTKFFYSTMYLSSNLNWLHYI